MRDVPLQSAAGLQVGMTVSVHDDRTHGGFYETFATITWIDGTWVGLDHGIEADYGAQAQPCLTTAHPLVCGHGVKAAVLRDLTLDGNRAGSPVAMGGCRGSAVYLARCRDVLVAGVRERDYHGEGLGFQMCRDITIRDCSFDDNTGNGLHPGAGSTNALFTDCGSRGNQRAGFFFCVRANHITVRRCTLADNALGVSVGTRDSHNLIEACQISGNRGPGVLFREAPEPTEAHSCRIRGCRICGNGDSGDQGGAQVKVQGPAHDLVLDRNTITAKPGGAAIRVAPGASRIYLEGNVIGGGCADLEGPPEAWTQSRPRVECGFGDWPEDCYRHLPECGR